MKTIKRNTLLIFSLCLLLIACNNAPINTEKPNIIPLPNKVEMGRGYYELIASTKILYGDETLKNLASYFQTALKKENGMELQVELGTKAEKQAILFQKEAGLDPEAYLLEINSKGVICKASDEAGILYGIQSLLQMVLHKDNACLLPAMKIEDTPARAWRGLMLDESRHFFGKETVMQYIDLLARLKMNRFHWHLSDEQGWRIEIKRYPKLTEIGAIGSWSDSKAEAKFYTQEDIKEIVAYAEKLNIMIIPEIDMPGHATAASRAYPEISGGGTGKWKGFTFHPTKESTYEFIDNVFSEIVELFPALYIHVGADEVHYGNQSWFTDPAIQKFIKDNDLKDEVGLEHYFIRRISDILSSKGKIMIGWDEIINAGVTPDKAKVMWWRHDKPELLTQALEKGFDVILTPRIPCYFDFVQDESHKIGRRWDGNYNPLPRVYNFPDSIQDRLLGHEKQVLGLQANLFTERIKDKDRLDFMVFPRLLAIAEVGWTQSEHKDYSSFETRAKAFMKYLETLGINYCNSFDLKQTPEPWGPDKEDAIVNG